MGMSNSNILHIPDSNPTAKQLLSLLNATESTAVGIDDSIGGRTFIMQTWRSCRCKKAVGGSESTGVGKKHALAMTTGECGTKARKRDVLLCVSSAGEERMGGKAREAICL